VAGPFPRCSQGFSKVLFLLTLGRRVYLSPIEVTGPIPFLPPFRRDSPVYRFDLLLFTNAPVFNYDLSAFSGPSFFSGLLFPPPIRILVEASLLFVTLVFSTCEVKSLGVEHARPGFFSLSFRLRLGSLLQIHIFAIVILYATSECTWLSSAFPVFLVDPYYLSRSRSLSLRLSLRS